MTIQAYQTLYESSIAYGMRKALQAEQSKAEMLMKIQNIQEESTDLEDEVDELRRRIDDMLKEETSDKQRAKDEHERDVNYITNEN